MKKDIGDIGMIKGGCFPGCSAAKRILDREVVDHRIIIGLGIYRKGSNIGETQ